MGVYLSKAGLIRGADVSEQVSKRKYFKLELKDKNISLTEDRILRKII